ncbi:hypothetical protein BN1723_000688, partial [Verticillium longisporum]
DPITTSPYTTIKAGYIMSSETTDLV